MFTFWFIFIIYFIRSKHFINATFNISSYATTDHKCVIVIHNQNKHKTIYRTFYYMKHKYTECTSNNKQININNPSVFVKFILNLNVSNCTVISKLDNHQEHLLARLLKHTHKMVQDCSKDVVLDSLLSKLFYSSKINCSQQKHRHIQAISMLTQHISVDLVSIVIVDCNCDIEFAKILKDEIQKKRAEEYSSLFNVRVYKIKYNDTDTMAENILHSIQKEKFHKRAFILLTPHEITTNFFEISSEIAMHGFNDIWITTHGKYNPDIIPSQTATVGGLKYREYKPVYRNEAVITDLHNKIFTATCSLSAYNSNLSETMEKYTFFETKDTILIKVWWPNSWKILYEIKEEQQVYSILPHLPPINFLGAVGLTQVISIVSIIEGPFLHETRHLYSFKSGECEDGSLFCKIPLKYENNTIWQSTCCYGYSVDFIKYLANLLGFKPDLYIVEDGKYGGYNEGKFNGMVGDVYNKKAKMAVAGLTANTERLKYVDFTQPFMKAEIGIVTLKDTPITPNYINMKFIGNLGTETKYSIVIIFILAILFIYGFENFVIYQQGKYNKRYRGYNNNKMYSWVESFTFTSGLMFQRGIGGVDPSTRAGKAMTLFLTLSMVAFGTLYTASLTADRVIQNGNERFKGLKDERMINPTDSFKFATSADTSMEAFFKTSPDETFNNMYRFMLKYNVKNIPEGLKKVLRGELQAYVQEKPFMEYFLAQHKYRDLKMHATGKGESTYAIAVSKDSDMKQILSRAILYMQENEKLSKLRKKWINLDNVNEETSTQQFNLHFFATPLLIVASGLVVSFVILWLEVLTANNHANKNQTQKKH